MAHFLLASIGSTGDLLPFIRLGIALNSLGHRTTFLTNPYFAQTITDYGLVFHPIGTKELYLSVLHDQGLMDEKTHFDIVTTKLLVPNLFAIDDYVSSMTVTEKLVIVAHQFFLPNAGIAKCKHPGVQVICGALFPSGFQVEPDKLSFGPFKVPTSLKRLLWRMVTKIIDKRYVRSHYIAPLNQTRVDCGQPALRHYKDLFEIVADWNILLFSDWFAQRQQGWPSNIIDGDFLLNEDPSPAPLSTEITQFLNAGTSPVMVTLGTGNVHGAQHFKSVVEALEQLGLRAILISNNEENFPDQLNSNCLCLNHVAQFRSLIQCCSLVIHHGGLGTMAETVLCAVPQLIIASNGEEIYNLAQITSINIGSGITSDIANVDVLVEKIRSILMSSSISKGCEQASARMKNRSSARDLAAKICIVTGH